MLLERVETQLYLDVHVLNISSPFCLESLPIILIAPPIANHHFRYAIAASCHSDFIQSEGKNSTSFFFTLFPPPFFSTIFLHQTMTETKDLWLIGNLPRVSRTSLPIFSPSPPDDRT